MKTFMQLTEGITQSAAVQPKCYSYIRFSTPEQLNGDSLRRQLKLSEEYARRRGLVIDDSLKLHDLGLSAYEGEHRMKGALGRFLKLVEQGCIPKGCHLIIEKLDRLNAAGNPCGSQPLHRNSR